ncbi:hypothetical protein [Sphingobacterium spiritivorum]|uniref:hypothetical protein n=1 Tax=Sphingobacterium spiritivorum TaxID=258 RepID=UPI0019186D95|nr:hypothetical protein [Sphingobacterium spiritivorum]QQT24874.1 hypothetical protein I6J02_14195 [Sphingobacterium spiritivorum]
MVDRILYLITALMLINSYSIGQPYVEKIIMHDNKAYLTVSYNKDVDSVIFSATQGYVNNLTDLEKLEMIKCLLKFEGDTTRHPGMGFPVYYANDARAIRFSPKSKYYTLEISSLYFVNRIAYGTYTDYYSPAPVLYDNIENVEINDCPQKVKLVFLEYKKWFDECIKTGKIPKYFPFNDGRYVWLYGKKSRFSTNGKLIE